MRQYHGGHLFSNVVKPEFSVRRRDDAGSEKGVQGTDPGISGRYRSPLLHNADRLQQRAQSGKIKYRFIKQVFIPETADITLDIIRKEQVGTISALVRRKLFPFSLFKIILLQTETQRKRIRPVFFFSPGEPEAHTFENRQFCSALCVGLYLSVPALLTDGIEVIGTVKRRQKGRSAAQPETHFQCSWNIL